MTARVLVAGIGNLFRGDDGFGPEVVRRLAAGGPLPPGVRVTDYGIRAVDLAYDLLDGWDTLILVDALPAAWQPTREPTVDWLAGGVSSHGVSSHGVSSRDASCRDVSCCAGPRCDGSSCDASAGVAAAGGGGPGRRRPGGREPFAGRSGEVVVVEVGPRDRAPGGFDAHGMQPVAVLGSLTAMGGKLPPTRIVGCPIESIHRGIGLSPAVAAAVPAAIDTILALLDHLPLTEPPAEPRRP